MKTSNHEKIIEEPRPIVEKRPLFIDETDEIFAYKAIFANMKRLIAIIVAIYCISIVSIAADNADTTEYKISGFSMGALPALSYDSDCGFQYGVLTELYWYSDGSNYPQYDHMLYLEVSADVIGALFAEAYLDSRKLIKNSKLTADFTLYNDFRLDFTGFNGRQSVYHEEFTDEDDDAYVSKVFYCLDRRMIRFFCNLQRQFGSSPWFWQAGVTGFNMKLSSVDRSKFRKSLPDVETIYDKYINWNIFKPREADGGFNAFAIGGFGIDTRDNESVPSSGIFTEVIFALAPKFFSTDNHEYGKLTIYHRQYIDLWRKQLVLAYRLGLQTKLWGDTPFYLLPYWTTNTSATSEGLGGSDTMRGVLRNRIVGDGSLLGNVELRYIFWKFRLFKQAFALGTNAFVDMGMVTQKYDIDTSQVPDDEYDTYFSNHSETMHWSLGAGLKIVYNDNFVGSCDFGKALSSNDGNTGLYITMDFIF